MRNAPWPISIWCSHLAIFHPAAEVVLFKIGIRNHWLEDTKVGSCWYFKRRASWCIFNQLLIFFNNLVAAHHVTIKRNHSIFIFQFHFGKRKMTFSSVKIWSECSNLFFTFPFEIENRLAIWAHSFYRNKRSRTAKHTNIKKILASRRRMQVFYWGQEWKYDYMSSYQTSTQENIY